MPVDSQFFIDKESFMKFRYRCSKQQYITNPGKRAFGSRSRAELAFAATVLAVLAVTGCDSGSFVPAPPPELSADSSSRDAPRVPPALGKGLESTAGSAPSVVLFLDRRDSDEEAIVTGAATFQAGIDRVKLKFANLSEQDLPARQTELVREAIERNALALVIEPADTADRRLLDAVREARAKGIPVVMLNKLLDGLSLDDSGTGSSKAKTGETPSPASTSAGAAQNSPLVLVTAPAFAPFAKQIVASAMRNAKNAHLTPEAGAIIVMNTISDSFAPERIAALRDALKAAGVKPVLDVSFTKSFEAGGKALMDKLKANPKVRMVFGVDTTSCDAAREASAKVDDADQFIMAGFASENHITDLTRAGDFAAIAEFIPLRVIRRGVTAGGALGQGQTVPNRIEQPITLYDSPEGATFPTSQRQYKQTMEQRKKAPRSTTKPSG
jgi:ABC-type sugar transport system substrate-binding protein